MRRATILLWGAALLTPTAAAAAPGHLYVTESSTGSVLEISQGGDLSTAQRFATGLSSPTGICVGPGGDVYVTETASGQITVLGEGGDLTDAEPFGYWGAGIASLWCDDERIIVACPLCNPTGVIEITPEGGGIIPSVSVVGLELPLPGDIVVDAAGSIFNASLDIYDITAGGSFAAAPSWTTGASMITAIDREGVLLGGEFQGYDIWDFTAGGDLTMTTPWASLPVTEGGIQAMVYHPELGTYALVGNAVYDIGDGGDLTDASPFAWGLDTGLQGLQGMAYHGCGTHSDCADGDLCNGGERCKNNECQPPAGPLDCDDDNICTADSCDAELGCGNDWIDGCCLQDLDCAVDELCDGPTNACVPTEVPPTVDDGGGDDDDDDDGSAGGDDDTGAGGTDVGDDGDADGGVGSSDGSSGGEDAGATDSDAGGCACRATPRGSAPWFLLVLLLVRRRR